MATQQHEITTTPHTHVETLTWVDCSCGEGMKNPATKGLVAEWVKDHFARFRHVTEEVL